MRGYWPDMIWVSYCFYSLPHQIRACEFEHKSTTRLNHRTLNKSGKSKRQWINESAKTLSWRQKSRCAARWSVDHLDWLSPLWLLHRSWLSHPDLSVIDEMWGIFPMSLSFHLVLIVCCFVWLWFHGLFYLELFALVGQVPILSYQ